LPSETVIDRKIEERIEVEGGRGRRHKQLLDDLKEKRGYWQFKKGSARSQSMENSLWKTLRTCRKTDCEVNE